MITNEISQRMQGLGENLGARGNASVNVFNRFSGFKPETEASIRGAPEPSLIVRQRQKREMLKGMSADQLMQVLEFHDNMSFFDALGYADSQGKVIAPNICVNKLFRDRSSEMWTGTAIVSEIPGKPFGNRVTFATSGTWDNPYTLSFEVPDDFSGRENCAIIMEHPDFRIVKLGEAEYFLEADRKDMAIIEGYPAKRKSSWTVRFVTDPGFGIPCGDTEEFIIARKAFNSPAIQFNGEDNPYVGAVCRTTSFSAFNSSQMLSATANLCANMMVAFY